LFAHVALPRIDRRPDANDLGTVVETTARSIRRAWHGPTAPPVRVLPYELATRALPATERRRVPIGIGERAFEPVSLDLLDQDQNLLVLGDGECGKTNLIRLITQGLIERHSPEEVVFAVMDPRRKLRDFVPEPYLGGYASNSRVCAGLAAGVAKELEGRMPDEGDQADLAEESRFDGPHVVVLVDDYHLLTAAGQQPLTAFLPFVPAGRDIGLHFVVTLPVAGASRGLYDPLLQAVREIGTSALLMSGDRSEGQLFPRVYPAQQPAGRGKWIRRGEPAHLIQTALLEAPARAARAT
jgi:S-DNA-T family DNA segregation ATPase FtsK/SpoIIIE